MEPFPYQFNPTSGIPLASHKEGDGPEKITWFSTIGPEQAAKADEYYKLGHNKPNKGKTMNEALEDRNVNQDVVLEVLDVPAPAPDQEVTTSEEGTRIFVQDETYSPEEAIAG